MYSLPTSFYQSINPNNSVLLQDIFLELVSYKDNVAEFDTSKLSHSCLEQLKPGKLVELYNDSISLNNRGLILTANPMALHVLIPVESTFDFNRCKFYTGWLNKVKKVHEWLDTSCLQEASGSTAHLRVVCNKRVNSDKAGLIGWTLFYTADLNPSNYEPVAKGNDGLRNSILEISHINSLWKPGLYKLKATRYAHTGLYPVSSDKVVWKLPQLTKILSAGDVSDSYLPLF